MSYVKAGDGPPIAPGTIAAVAALVELDAPPERLAGLATAVRNQLDAIVALDALGLEETMPAVEFDPRWRTADGAAG